MFDLPFLLSLLKKENVNTILNYGVIFSFVILSDIYLTILLGNYFTDYFVLSFLCFFCLLGIFFIKRYFEVFYSSLQARRSTDKIPESDFYYFTGYFMSSIFLLIPGIITGVMGLILLIPGITTYIGKTISRKLSINWNIVYEYYSINR